MPKKPAPKKPTPRQASTKTTAPPRQILVVPTRLNELTLPTLEEEARLLDAARRIEALKPWQKLKEDQLFVVENPDDGQRGFVSVLGALGAQFSVLIYRGEGAYFQLQSFLEAADADEADAFDLLKIDQLHLTFDIKNGLEPWDEALLKRHKVAVRGRGLFPAFSSLCIGYLPWRIDGAEARFLTAALEQLAEVVSRADFSPSLFKREKAGGTRAPRHTFFARLPQRDANDSLIWRDERLTVEPPPPYLIELPDCDDSLEQIAAKPLADEVWEIDFDSIPMPVATPDERPYFPEVVLIGCDGQLLAQAMTTQGFWAGAVAEMTEIVLNLLAEQPKRPRQMAFNDPRLGSAMHLIHTETPIEVKPQQVLPTLDDAFESLLESVQLPIPEGLLDDLDGLEGLDPSVFFGLPPGGPKR